MKKGGAEINKMNEELNEINNRVVGLEIPDAKIVEIMSPFYPK